MEKNSIFTSVISQHSKLCLLITDVKIELQLRYKIGTLVRCQMALFPVTLNDPQLPQTTPFSTFCIAFHISLQDVKLQNQNNVSQPLNHCLRHKDLQAVASSQQIQENSSSFQRHQDVVRQ